MIKTVYDNQEEILKHIIELHNNGMPIECDPTYSKGNFYKGDILPPKLKFDIDPVYEDVVESSSEDLPLENESISSLIFDPPFLATKGKSLKNNGSGNIINKRFSVFPDEKSLHEFYINSLREFFRVLKKDGILIFKCQDKVSSGKQYFSHCFVMYEAFKIGFYPLDLFVLISKNRIVANWQRNQKHARKFHSYFWVFKKSKPKVDYMDVK